MHAWLHTQAVHTDPTQLAPAAHSLPTLPLPRTHCPVAHRSAAEVGMYYRLLVSSSQRESSATCMTQAVQKEVHVHKGERQTMDLAHSCRRVPYTSILYDR
jgi:hypothetical protein